MKSNIKDELEGSIFYKSDIIYGTDMSEESKQLSKKAIKEIMETKYEKVNIEPNDDNVIIEIEFEESGIVYTNQESVMKVQPKSKTIVGFADNIDKFNIGDKVITAKNPYTLEAIDSNIIERDKTSKPSVIEVVELLKDASDTKLLVPNKTLLNKDGETISDKTKIKSTIVSQTYKSYAWFFIKKHEILGIIK